MANKCVVISCFNHYETRTKSIIQHYKNEGFEVKYLFMDFNHFKKEMWNFDIPEAVKIHAPRYQKNLSVQRLWSHYVFAKKVQQFLKEYNPDIIYSLFPPNSLVKRIAEYKREHVCKVILDCYDAWPESFPTKSLDALLKYPFKLWAKLRNDYIDCADLIISVSQAGTDFLKTITDRPVRLLMPLIDNSGRVEYKSNVDVLSFVYLGNINHITDTDLLVNFLLTVASKKKVELHVIGKGQHYHILEEAFAESNVSLIGHGVVFDPMVKKEIYAKCNFGINFPKEEIQSTMSLKSVEYISEGLPFVNSAGGDTWRIVGEYRIGYNVNDTSLDEMVAQILKLDCSMITSLHENVLETYNKLFACQNLRQILDT